MDLGIAGKWALVCGASKGLGYACAKALAEEGVNLVVAARSIATLEEAAGRLAGPGRTVIAVQADVTSSEGRENIFAANGGPGVDFDILVTNSGGPPAGDYRQWTDDEWITALRGNMLTPIALIKAVIDGMARRRFGRIVNITSVAVKAPIAELALSNGARSGLTGFIAGLARSEVARHNVTVNNLLPGQFDTGRLRNLLESRAALSGQPIDSVVEASISDIPARRFGSPDEFGQYCAFLCSAQASYINGQNLLIDGASYPGVF